MPSEKRAESMLSFFDQSAESLAESLRHWGWPEYRAAQVLDWVYRKGVADPKQMSNLPRSGREDLSHRLSIASASIACQQISNDGTIKLLLTWPDGRSAETVMIPDGPRRTACVSSQTGCPVGCKFCASGLNGLQGNLSPGQIVEQIFMLNQIMQPAGVRITNVVYMGMGEPLANYANVLASVRNLHDARGFDLGARRITISTVGVPAKIRSLAEESLPVNLALSLHAPNEELRKELIPWAEHFALKEILDAVRYYFDRTGREITLEYILLAGVDDRVEHARQLVRLCRTLRCNVNLIKYNAVVGLPFGRPKLDDVVRFQEVLRRGGVNAHVRKSRGRDIDAACGQLRRRVDEAGKPVQVGIAGRRTSENR